MGRLRIIAGALRGRRFSVPDLPGLRPTPERVREALFSRLGEKVIDARVLDAFAGTGALGLEALSRGAQEVTFIEQNAYSVSALRERLESWQLTDRSRVIQGDAHRLPVDATEAWDLILADPPYFGDDSSRFARTLVEEGRILPGGYFSLEREKGAKTCRLEGLSLIDSSTYGDSMVELYRFDSIRTPT